MFTFKCATQFQLPKEQNTTTFIYPMGS